MPSTNFSPYYYITNELFLITYMQNWLNTISFLTFTVILFNVHWDNAKYCSWLSTEKLPSLKAGKTVSICFHLLYITYLVKYYFYFPGIHFQTFNFCSRSSFYYLLMQTFLTLYHQIKLSAYNNYGDNVHYYALPWLAQFIDLIQGWQTPLTSRSLCYCVCLVPVGCIGSGSLRGSHWSGWDHWDDERPQYVQESPWALFHGSGRLLSQDTVRTSIFICLVQAWENVQHACYVTRLGYSFVGICWMRHCVVLFLLLATG